MFHGYITALITPFTAAGDIDKPALKKLVDRQIGQGISGIVPVGTTGESPSLSHEEHHLVVQEVTGAAKGRVPVIAGAGSNSTAEAVSLTRHAEKAGADAALVVTPYYNKPTQSGLYAHFKAVHDASDIPIIIYNIPGRSVVDMVPETMAKLAELPRIAGVKDATGDLVRPAQTAIACGPDFCQLSGEDATLIPFLAQGGHGCISVSSNIAPDLCVRLYTAWAEGDRETMTGLNLKLMALHEALFCESSPGPAKYAASLLGLCRADMRLPMVAISDASKHRVAAALKQTGLL